MDSIELDPDAPKTSKVKLTREERTERDREKLLEGLRSGNLRHLIEKVAWVLNHFTDTRNSDVTCLLRYWHKFEPNYDGTLEPKDLYALTKLTSIARARAKIQNEYKLFLGTTEVMRRRHQLSEEQRLQALEDKPDYLGISVYADETGKTEKYVSVGSLWILDGVNSLAMTTAILGLKEKRNFKQEIHFADIGHGTVDFYLSLIDVIFDYSSVFSFKAQSVERAGNKNMTDTLEKMFYLLLIRGIEHEVTTRRISLPRTLEFFKDSDSAGSDQLMCATLQQKIRDHSVTHLDGEMHIGDFKPYDSKKNLFLQVADLFTSSINRAKNQEITSDSPKSQVARRMIEKFGLSETDDEDFTRWGDI